MKYFRGWVSLPLERFFPAVSDKAVAFTIAGGYTSANDTVAWFPKSQIKIGDPNEYGNAEILIPYWLMKQKAVNPIDYFHRIREVGQYNGEDFIVDR